MPHKKRSTFTLPEKINVVKKKGSKDCRKLKSVRSTLKFLAEQRPPEEEVDVFFEKYPNLKDKIGDINNMLVSCWALVERSQKGDVTAFKEFRDSIGERPVDVRKEETPTTIVVNAPIDGVKPKCSSEQEFLGKMLKSKKS